MAHSKALARTEAFSDGVFAIAATLLVLDLTAQTLGNPASNDALWQALLSMRGQFFSFVLSFVLIALLWMTHTGHFQRLERVDGLFLWLNTGRLMFVVLMPFATSVVAEDERFMAARMMLPTVYFGALLFGWLQWQWASARGGHLLLPEARDRAGLVALSSGMPALIALLVIPLSIVVGEWAFLLFVLDRPLTRLLGVRRGAWVDEAPATQSDAPGA